MRYAVRLNNYLKLDCYGKVLYYFERNFLERNNIKMDADKFIHDFGKYIETSKFPCDKITLDPFCGYSDIFQFVFYYKDETICWVKIVVTPLGIMQIHNYGYMKKDFEMFHHIITDYFDKRNKIVFTKLALKANVSLTTNDNEVEVVYFKNYQENNAGTMKGTVKDIFNEFTSYNDTFKYCNGMYVQFKNKDIEKMFFAFCQQYKGNFFLDNAVKRGCIID